MRPGSMERHFDVLIVGSGLVGSTAAIALCDSGLKVGLVEALPESDRKQNDYDERSLALAWGSRRIFERLDVWGEVADYAQPIQRVHISHRGHFGKCRLDARDHPVEALGYVVPAMRLHAALQARLQACPSLERFCPARLTDFQTHNDRVHATVQPETGPALDLQAALLIAADGARSAVRSRLNIETRRWDYGQTAVIANLSSAHAHNDIAYERFTESGPVALLPMRHEERFADYGAGRWALVWTVAARQADTLLGWDEAAFLHRLQTVFGFNAGRFTHLGRRRSFPLQMLRAKRDVDERVVLLGNAAHALHPVAGQGLNLSLRDVALLNDLLRGAAASGGDPGDPRLLRRYVEGRRRDQMAVIAFTDALARAFVTPLWPVVLARDVGLTALDVLTPLKRAFTRHTMGLGIASSPPSYPPGGST